MRLTVWDPFRGLTPPRIPNRFLYNTLAPRRPLYPHLELVKDDDSVTVTAQLPDIDKEDLELTVLGDTLTIAGEKKLPAEEGVTYIRHERPHGKFRRLVELPYSVAPDKIKASYTDGILTITLPRAEETKPRQIAVA